MTGTRLSPDDLPSQNAQFIAYGPEQRCGSPISGEDPITIRPQAYVFYYAGIAVKEIKGGRGSIETVSVGFDPESVGLREPITAYLDPDDPLVEYLTAKHAAGETVSIGIEILRKAKTKTDKTPISPLTPIHALRGAKTPSGNGSDMTVSGENIRKVLALVDGQPSKGIGSDPTEWKVLTANRAGDLPPEGWRHYAPGEDWKQIGAIVPSGAPTRNAKGGAAAALDLDALAVVVRDAVEAVLKARDDAEAAKEQASENGRPVGGKWSEGKRWDVRATDGKINLGSYLVTAESGVLRWGFDYLTSHADEANPVEEGDVEGFAGLVMDCADQTQANAYGHGTQPDRIAASHHEAIRWVEWVIEHGHPFPKDSDLAEDADLDTVMESWMNNVVTGATQYLTLAGQRAGQHLASKNKARESARQAAPAAARDDQPTGPSPKLVTAMLAGVHAAWDKAEALRNFGTQATERGIADAVVGIAIDSATSRVVLSFPAEADALQKETLLKVLQNRYKVLVEGAAGNTGNEPQPVQATEPVQEPVQGPAPVQAAPAPAAAAPAAPQQQTSAVDPNRGYSAAVASLIQATYRADTEAALREVYEKAKAEALLATPVSARIGDTKIAFGANGEDGFEVQALSDVILAKRNILTGSQQAAQTPAAAPAAAPEPQQDPEPEPAPEPEPEPAPEPTPATGGEPDRAAAAQAIADQATNDTPGDTVRALMEQARAEGLLDVKIMANGASGPLERWLTRLVRRHASQTASV